MGYLPIAASESLKEWKIAITLVRQGYKSTERHQDYKTGTGTTYNRKLKCFNYNKYGHMVKECWKKKEKEMRKCFKCNREEHIAKDCKRKQSMKK